MHNYVKRVMSKHMMERSERKQTLMGDFRSSTGSVESAGECRGVLRVYTCTCMCIGGWMEGVRCSFLSSYTELQ